MPKFTVTFKAGESLTNIDIEADQFTSSESDGFVYFRTAESEALTAVATGSVLSIEQVKE